MVHVVPCSGVTVLRFFLLWPSWLRYVCSELPLNLVLDEESCHVSMLVQRLQFMMYLILQNQSLYSILHLAEYRNEGRPSECHELYYEADQGCAEDGKAMGYCSASTQPSQLLSESGLRKTRYAIFLMQEK